MLEKRNKPSPLPLPEEAEVPCSYCGAICIEEYVEVKTDPQGWILGRKKVRACYSCGNVEDA